MILVGNAICYRNPNWWIWCITTKKNELRLDLNRALADPSEVILKRARVALERVRANFDITCRRRQRLPRLQLVRTNFDITFLNQLYCHDKRGRGPQFASRLKGIKIGTLLSSGQLGDQSSVFLHNWHWLKMRSKLLCYFRQPAGGSILPRNEWFNEKKNWGRFTWLSTLASFFFPCTLSSYFMYN